MLNSSMAVSQSIHQSYVQLCAARIGALGMSDVRFFALLGAIVIYGLWGSPTPDGLGLAELVIAALLFCAIGLGGFYGIISNQNASAKPLWFQVGRIALIVLSLTAGAQFLLYGHDMADALRDIIALGFLGLPLLFYGLMAGRPDRFKIFIGVVAMSGFFFALRSLTLFAGTPLFGFLQSDELAYLSNAPTVLFGGIICGALAWQVLTGERLGRYKALWPLLVLAVLVILLAITVTMQRASLALMVLSFAVIAGQSFKAKPYRALALILLVALGAMAMWPLFHEIWSALAYKNRTAGANMRIEDLKAIWAAIGDTPMSLLFGLGFGGSFESPAVGNYTVNFAHGLFSASLLKFGLVGTALMMAYMGCFLWEIVKIPQSNMRLALALSAPFMICVFLYASYKSLDFGLLLSLIAFSSVAQSAASRDLH